MKKTLVATLIAAPLLTLSSLTFAMELKPVSGGAMLLSATELDNVTAGRASVQGSFNNWANIAQTNISPVTVVQIGNYNTAIIYSGNFLFLNQNQGRGLALGHIQRLANGRDR